MPDSQQYEVLIVGLGPVGAVMAALCAKLGLRVRAVERDTEIYKLPRAVQIDFEVLRLLNFIGVADAVLENSCPSKGYEFVNRDREILMSRYPPSQLAPTRYPWNNMFHQPSLEAALRARLEQLNEVEISLGANATGIEQDGKGVTAIVETANGAEQIRADFAVGCDGGRSFVRKSLGIDMVDLGFDEPWLVVDVTLPPGMRQLFDVSTQLCDPANPTTSALSGPGRHRWEFMLRPDEERDAAMRTENIKARLSEWVDCIDSIQVERCAIYEFHGLIAQRWRSGRIALIGDAAHQMPPFYGQGLCSGIRDAFNLAWKLALALCGQAPVDLLDTVQSERDPHVATITRNAIELGKIVCVADEAGAAERDRRMLADRESGRAPPFPAMPHITRGVMQGAAAGKTMPEPMVGDELRLDDTVGYVPVLVLANGKFSSAQANAFKEEFPEAAICCLANGADGQLQLRDESGHLGKMLDGAPALLAKPDRIVLGTGDPAMLAEQWRTYLKGELQS